LNITSIGGFTNQELNSLFSLSLIAPTSCPVRMQHAQMIESEFLKIGIEAELDLISWSAIGSRGLDTIVGPYDEGGFDILIFGMSLGELYPGASLSVVYHENGLPPDGFNVMYWANQSWAMTYRASENNELIDQINSEFNQTRATELLIEWQKLWYDVMPNVLLYNLYEVHAVSTGFYGYDPFGYVLDSAEDHWTDGNYAGTADDLVIAGVSEGTDEWLSLISTDVYDAYMNEPLLDSLVGLTPSTGIVLPEGTDRDAWMTAQYGSPDPLKLVPRMATAMGTWDTAGLNYSIEVRDDIYWHDGVQYDAWDAAFSFQATIIPDMTTSLYSENALVFGPDDADAFHGNYSFQVKDLDGNGFYETLNIIVADVYAPFELSVLPTGNYPEHILGDPVTHGMTGWTTAGYESAGWNFSGMIFDPNANWQVTPADWITHSMNTGNPADPGGFWGPIGTGSLVVADSGYTSGTVELKKFNETMWDGSNWITNTSNSHWNIVNLDKMPNTYRSTVTTTASGIASMKTGVVNIMDPQFNMGNILGELQAESTIHAVLNTDSGWQALWFNPQFNAPTQLGTNDRPLNRKGVRHAISHIIPRDDIINFLLNGLARPAYTPVPVTSWGIISENEMIAFKRSVNGADGSIPEYNATTAFDEYNIDIALKWMSSEGYDMRPWNGPVPINYPGEAVPLIESTIINSSQSISAPPNSTTSTSFSGVFSDAKSESTSASKGLLTSFSENTALEPLVIIFGVLITAFLKRYKTL
jgi:ABC-type transport system substrate-binding protein